MEKTTNHTTGCVNVTADMLPAEMSGYSILTQATDDRGCIYLLTRKGTDKKLVITAHEGISLPYGFEGKKAWPGAIRFLICDLTAANAAAIRLALPFTRPVLLGKQNSFGFGDRLGNAGSAHLRSLRSSGFLPVLAQQSIRELDRTGRTALEVMDAATWAVFQENYTAGFGADADHLKTFKDIDRMMEAGYTMYTIDPSDYVDNRVVDMDEPALAEAFDGLPWDQLGDTPFSFLRRYAGVTFRLQNGITLQPTRPDIMKAAVKYGRVILHTLQMYRYLKDTYPNADSEVELSVDETPYPTTPEEHLVIASELKRLHVEFVSLAPRFCGEFEKGIDFKGSIKEFQQEYKLHQSIAAAYGEYKLSIHSGSDKFRVYEAIGSLGLGTVHIKTAGTSYLEALRAVALTDPGLLRNVLAFSLQRFDTDRKTYHISAESGKIARPDSISDADLAGLLDDDNARQVFHVTYGSVLTAKTPEGDFLFRDRFMSVLAENETVYENCLYRHFRRHIKPFER
ncbi:MAG: tagaturonate epimerase family protein [Cyclonatronaceae bacterium]